MGGFAHLLGQGRKIGPNLSWTRAELQGWGVGRKPLWEVGGWVK